MPKCNENLLKGRGSALSACIHAGVGWKEGGDEGAVADEAARTEVLPEVPCIGLSSVCLLGFPLYS